MSRFETVLEQRWNVVLSLGCARMGLGSRGASAAGRARSLGAAGSREKRKDKSGGDQKVDTIGDKMITTDFFLSEPN
eukprot:3767482-Amphidinium_carterae.1